MSAIPVDGIDLIIYDFDGVMTDNRALVDENGVESVVVNRSDGLAVQIIAEAGIPQMIISTESNRVVSARANKLGLPVIQSVDDKREAVQSHLESNAIDPSRVLYIGNDINDRGAMLLVGWPLCPSDAYPAIREISRVVLATAGGAGVVRELLDHLGLADA
jgi:3-deoxy-D-manno-octulosonate 8-phosphate phosphatase (KDO 8-P phosphatase)